MNQVFQFIGTFASIISVPLAVYFYIKTMDGKYKKIRGELIDLFLHYIGTTGNRLSSFTLSSVINAKLRENNLKTGRITADSVIEDLTVEIISNPLLNNEYKKEILDELEKMVYAKYNPKILKQRNSPDEHFNDIPKQKENGKKVSSKGKQIKTYKRKKSTINLDFIILCISILSTVLSILISSGQVTKILDVIDLTNPFTQIFFGMFLSIIAVLATFLIDKFIEK